MKLSIFQQYKDNVILNRFAKVFSVDVLVKASGFILLPVYLKLMTQQEYGLYSYLISIISTFSVFLNFGLYIAQSKLYQDLEHKEKGRLLFTIHITLSLALLPLLLIIYGFKLDYVLLNFLFKNPINYSLYRFPILIAVVTSVYSFMLSNYFLTSERIRYIQRFNFLRLLLVNGLVLLILFFFKGDAVGIRLKYSYMVELSITAVFFYFYIKAMSPSFDRQLAFKSLKLGLPIMASALCDIVINFGDKFFLEKYVGFKELSIYYLAFSGASVIPFFFSTLQNVWLPIFLKEKNLSENLRKTKKMIKQVSILLLLLCIGILVFVKLVLWINLIDNQKYSAVLRLLPIMLLSQAISALTHLLINYVVYFEQTYFTSLISVCFGCISLVCNLLFIRTYGMYGAAFSLLGINVLQFGVYYLLLKWNVRKRLVV